MKLHWLLVLAALLVTLAAGSAYAGNAALLSNYQMVNNGATWTMMFDLANTGPARDAIFSVQISGVPSAWSIAGPDSFSVYGIGTTMVNLSDGFAGSWTGEDSGPRVQFKCGNGSSTGYYRIYGQAGAPAPNVFDGTKARFSWTFYDNGKAPESFVLTPDMFKVHFQIIGDNWQNNGQSYVGDTTREFVPEPSSAASLLGLAVSAGALIKRRRG